MSYNAKFSSLQNKIVECVIEIRKKHNYANIIIDKIICVDEYSKQEIAISAHIGRIRIKGEGLGISILQNKSSLITGKIEVISFE